VARTTVFLVSEAVVLKTAHKHTCAKRACENQERGRLLFPFPTLRIGVPNAVGEHAIQIGKVWVTVAVEA
jgi:hypothetical protein